MNPHKEFEDKSNLFWKTIVPLVGKFTLMKRKTRVLVIVQDLEEWESELESFNEACETLSYWRDLRCAIIKKAEVSKVLYEQHKFEWFREGSRNTIVLIREDKSLALYDLDTDTQELKGWLTDATLRPLDELNPESEIIMKKIWKPIWLFFVALELEHNDEKSIAECKVFLDWVKHVAYDYRYKYQFMYVEMGKFTQKKFQDLGGF